ncbi:MAG: 4Fe-4S binding protein [Phascolarctobacterium sp.]|nr:4Fe-4S binding protein [Phascolarctobacterium sp.]
METGFTSIHVPCARIPLANILTGQWQYSGPTSLFLCLVLILVSLWFGPLFCGWLCPAGAFSEYLSRLLPDKYKINWAQLVPLVPLRYGFFLGFLGSIILGLGIPCSYCNYYALEIFVGYLHTGQLFNTSLSLLMTFVVSNIILGLFTKGGRGYCNLLCPVGTMCSLMHVLGQLVPGAFGMQVDQNQCVGCGLCSKKCPMQAVAITQGKAQINRHHCIVCGQCRQVCPRKAITYTNGMHREVAKNDDQE